MIVVAVELYQLRFKVVTDPGKAAIVAAMTSTDRLHYTLPYSPIA